MAEPREDGCDINVTIVYSQMICRFRDTPRRIVYANIVIQILPGSFSFSIRHQQVTASSSDPSMIKMRYGRGLLRMKINKKITHTQ